MTTEVTMEKITALAKNRGFIFPGSEIYGGLANTWDYGPLGVELKNNIKDAWRRKFVHESKYNVGLDAAILMNPETWVASGHVGGFADPLIDCKACKSRFRADQLIEAYLKEQGITDVVVDGWSNEKMESFIAEKQIPCPDCGKSDFTGIRQFNLMFKTFQGVTEDSKSEIYLRPETAQGIFVNFKSVQRTARKKIPFGIAQVGKSFRNEITPGNFIFRTREFEQMELEFFCKPGTELEWFAYWKDFCAKFLTALGLKEDHIKLRDHDPEDCPHCKALPAPLGADQKSAAVIYSFKSSSSSSPAECTRHVAPEAMSCASLRKPHVTEMQGRPQFFAISRSTSESPIYTHSSRFTSIRRMTSKTVSGAGLRRISGFSPTAVSIRAPKNRSLSSFTAPSGLLETTAMRMPFSLRCVSMSRIPG